MLKVAVLAGTAATAAEIVARVADMEDCKIWLVLCPEDGRRTLRRLAKEFWALLKARFPISLLKIALKGRIIFLRDDLNHVRSTRRLRAENFDVGLHKAGIIYRQQTIESFGLGILNSHIGILPEYRGRSVVEWSLVQGDVTGVTVFFIDTGIDTGERIVLREHVTSKQNTIAETKRYLFSLDAELYRKALVLLLRADCHYSANDFGHRYYPMSNLLSGVAERLLQTQCTATPSRKMECA